MEIEVLAPALATEGKISQVRLSPDGRRLAFTVAGAADAGLYVADVGAGEALKLVGYPGWQSPEIGWSPDGALVAYRIAAATPGYDDQVGWVSAAERGEINRCEGQAFAWAPRARVLFVADCKALALVRHDPDQGTSRPLSDFHHHNDQGARFVPRVASSPDGARLAYVARNELEDTSRVFCVERRNGELKTELLTWIPGADAHVFPFWSPKGVSLGLYVVHQGLDKTGIVLVKGLQGEGEIFYESAQMDGLAPPAWAPDGHALALVRRGDELCRLDLGDRSLHPLCAPGAVRGEPRFAADGRLVVEGGAAAYLLAWAGG
ncbi:MAG: PD40 domain-containing protein [Deltaproteobacteria bacterium]|nr:PD40 domain-containing protein [Deltaproteobacteria bacterium]